MIYLKKYADRKNLLRIGELNSEIDLYKIRVENLTKIINEQRSYHKATIDAEVERIVSLIAKHGGMKCPMV